MTRVPPDEALLKPDHPDPVSSLLPNPGVAIEHIGTGCSREDAPPLAKTSP